MEPLLEDVIDSAIRLSRHGIQITVKSIEKVVVHYYHPDSAVLKLRTARGPTVRAALYNAIADMES